MWGGEIKKPRSALLQGRISDPRYHPAYLPGEIPSDSDKSYPGNGGNRIPLLGRAPVYRIDSGTRPPNPPHRLAPTAGSLEHGKGEDFSINVFNLYTYDI